MKSCFSKIKHLPFAVLCLSMSMKGTAQPNPYPNGTQVSFIRTWDAMAPEADPNSLMTRQLKDVKQATQYFDGLGRPVQTVMKQGSLETNGTPADMVSPVVYDDFKREQYKYLPFASVSNDGQFKLNPFQQQAAFYGDPNGVLKGQGETYYYSKTNFEASPLNRPDKVMAAGNSWVGSNRGVETKYWVNTSTDDVKKWSVTDVANSWGSYSMTGSYNTGDLVKNVTADEHSKQVQEFKDKEGKVILKKVQLTASADNGNGSNYTGWLCTYYIYDDLGNLRCVIQPQAVKLMSDAGNWNLASYLDEQCFRYEYDQKGRMIRKKVPGAGEVYMVYDARDRLVLTQDASMRVQQKWMYTSYDEQNRPVSTGLINDNSSLLTHQNNAANSTTYPNLANYPGYEELTKTFYDDYTWLAQYGNPVSPTYDASYDSYFQPTTNIWPYPQANTPTSQLRGMATGTRVKVLGTSSYLYTVTFYDQKGRVIQVQSKNYSGGVDILTTQYTWAGQPLITVQKQQKTGTNAQTTISVTQITYDDLGRVTKIEKKASNTLVNGGAMPSAYKTIVQNEYDKLGQLKKKSLGTNPNTNAALETMSYDYNIRGWMLGANRDYAKDLNSTNYFGFDLGYDKANNNIIGGQAYANPQYNGNIEGMVWKSKGDGEKRKYDFSYDAANRLMKADYTEYTGGTFSQSSGVNFNMKMGDGSNVNSAYDANGNILQMQQWGLKITGSVQIDNLAYLYQNNSNKLARVTDGNNDPNTKLGDFHDGTNSGDDYSYDVNGNMNLDNNKAISSITYNYLNLPSEITVTGKGTVTYTYDASGNKLQKVSFDIATNQAKTTQYIGGAVYENDVLQFIGHEEGRIRFKPAAGNIAASLQYDYMLKDHLGNVRMVLTEEQQQDIYPAATLESTTYNGGTAISVEDDYYTVNSSQVVSQSTVTGIPTYDNQNNNGIPVNNNPYSNTTANSQQLYKISGNDASKTGLGITLKVMAGDKIDIFGKSYYFQTNTGGTSGTNSQMILEILNGMLGGPTGGTAGNAHGGVIASQLSSLPATTSGINTMLNQQGDQGQGDPPPPLAYINYIFFDEQFKFVNGGFSQAGTQNQLKNHSLQNLTAQKSGYVYIYVSNISTINVFFDNLQVVHTRGPILEETHYYPFGLTMSGISSKALAFGGAPNKEKTFQGQRFDDEFDLDWVQFKWRNHDPQIGRFIEIDPLAEEYEYNSTYAFSENKVISHVELEGLEAVEIIVGAGEAVGAGAAVTAAAVAAPVVAVVTHPEILLSGGASAAQMDLKVERQTMTASRSSTSSSASQASKASGDPAVLEKVGVIPEGSLWKPSVNTSQAGNGTTGKGSIYKVPGDRTQSGKPYVGRTKHSDPAKRGSSDGRQRRTEDKIDNYDPKKPEQGRIKEQEQIDKEGLKNLDNKRNEIKKPKTS